MTKIAHGLLTWQDGRELLERCIRSTAPYVDHLLIAEGIIDGIPDLGLAPHSDLAWMAEPSDFLPAEIPISSKAAWPGQAPWPTLSSKCNWLLGEARRRDCEWLLILDADEELHNGDRLRAWLDSWPVDLAAFPISRKDGKSVKRAPWHLLRVPLVKRYVHGVGYVELADGTVAWLVDEHSHDVPDLKRAPWLSHHPELRPPWRRGLRLGEWETRLEPQPSAPALQLPRLGAYSPAVNATGTSPRWYCPGCGRRYNAPGICAEFHPPTELEEDPGLSPVVEAPSAASPGHPQAPTEPGPPPAETPVEQQPLPGDEARQDGMGERDQHVANAFTQLHAALDVLERLVR